MTLQDLLYCALVASANEACNIIAEYISGSIRRLCRRDERQSGGC
jgi:D-alanyl-D-alanine carboxypeptidase